MGRSLSVLGLLTLLLGISVQGAWSVHACPFCSVTSQTLSEELAGADVAVLARLVKGALPPSESPGSFGGFGAIDPDTGSATFEIYEVLRGKEHVVGMDEINVIFFGPPDQDKSFLISGIGTGPIDWTTPLPLSEAAVEYVRLLGGLPEKGADRLAFFQEYFEHDDPLLAQDAYDEFARAPYDEVIALSDRMHHDQLVDWINSSEVSPSRRRLYLTMLGVCGTDEDLPMLEEMILSDYRTKKPMVEGLVQVGLGLGGPLTLPLVTEVVDLDERRKKLGLDAMIACYLRLKGAEGLDMIDTRFLKDQEVEYTQIYQTIMAMRFHGEETDIIPRERLLVSMRLLLDHPDFADQVIPDLARWQDWEVLDRLVSMFKESDERSFIRQPVVSYLIVAAEQEGDIGQRADVAIEELEELAPDTVERARSLMNFGFLARARPAGDGSNFSREGDAPGELASGASDADADDVSDIPDPTDPQFQPAEEETVAATPSIQEEPVAEATASPVASTVEPAVDERLPVPHPLTIVGVPLLAGAVLIGLFWLILRGSGV